MEKWKIRSMCYLRKGYIWRSNPTRNRAARTKRRLYFASKMYRNCRVLPKRSWVKSHSEEKVSLFFYFRQVNILHLVCINWKLLFLLVWEKLYFFGVADTIKNLGKHLKIQNAISIMLIILMPVKSPRVPPENMHLNLVM